MIDRAFAEDFATAWMRAWNTHDIVAILNHYTDDVLFHSPRIRTVTGEDIDFVRGLPALRAYWTRALAAAPDLHFEIKSVLVGSDALTIVYANHRAQTVAETFAFRGDGKVQVSYATYA